MDKEFFRKHVILTPNQFFLNQLSIGFFILGVIVLITGQGVWFGVSMVCLGVALFLMYANSSVKYIRDMKRKHGIKEDNLKSAKLPSK